MSVKYDRISEDWFYIRLLIGGTLMMSMSITRTSLTRAFFKNSFLEGHKGIYKLAQGGSGPLGWLCILGHYPSSRLFLSLTWEPHCTVLGKSKSLHMIGMCRLQALYRESTLSLASPCNVADEQRGARGCEYLFITPTAIISFNWISGNCG